MNSPLDDFKIVAKPAWHAYQAATQVADHKYKQISRAAYNTLQLMMQTALGRDRETYMAIVTEALNQYEKALKLASADRQKVSDAAWQEYEKVVRPAWEAYQVVSS